MDLLAHDHPVYEVVSPEGWASLDAVQPTAPVTNLSGKTVAELWDYRFKGDEMFAIFERELAARFPGIRFLSWDLFGNIHQANEDPLEILERLPRLLRERGCDAVIVAVGA